ncbi:senescence-associated protein-domain-containing protein [Trametes polyzona]|nr:senescence-associated protein-domain-containing protein [Trametes polyzona]
MFASLIQTGLLRLPEELRIEVLRHLDVRSLLRCCLVCKDLRETVKASLQLKYNIELFADGLVDGVGCPLPVAERYNLLLERRRRWRRLKWKSIEHFSAPGMCQAYELVDGVFATSKGIGFSGSRHLALTWLPTATSEARRIERDDLGFSMRDFAMDPSQDLIAFVLADEPGHHQVGSNIVICLLTLSKNKPHPQARLPEISVNVPLEIDRSFVQVADDVIGMFFWIHGPALVIWNWRTGKLLVKCIGFDLPNGAYDFAFLSSRAYMITVTADEGAIEIFTFDGDGDAAAPEKAHSPSISDRVQPTKVAVLRLPPVKPGQGPTRFQTHSGPFVARPTPGRPFETSPDCRLHVMELNYGVHGLRQDLFMRNSYLLSYVPSTFEAGTAHTPVVKTWDEWGPDNTRFWMITGRFQWLRCGAYVHGERVVLPSMVTPWEASSARTGLMVMLDFNVHPKRLDDSPLWANGTDEASVELITDERVFVEESVFQQPVVSRLPFMAVAHKRPRPVPDYSGFMIGQDHIVGMKSIMSNTLITIPGVTAHHILGEAAVALGADELNLVPTGPEKELTLTVGGAGFALRKGTEFGTLEGDPRAYVFSPEIEGVHGGYVRCLTLPEGVTEDGSRLSELQTKFEEILIEHGFLQPAEESSARQRIKDAIHSQSTDSLVTIPGAVAAQVLGEDTTILSEGTLTLVVIPREEDEGTGPLLTLTVGKAAFPLFVAIVLPEAGEQPSADLAELQNEFELALIEYGLLKDGFEAAADEISRSVRENSARTAERIRRAKELYLQTYPRTIEPAHFSQAAHNVTESSATGTQSLANAAHWVSGAVTSAASSAGAWIASTFVPTRPEATAQLDSAARGVSIVVQGVSEGVGEVKDTLKNTAAAVVENDYGEEARTVTGNVGQSVANVGAVAGDAATVTSGAAFAVAGLQGAASRQDAEQREVSGKA